ncbi:MAG: bifunctional 5,10-methylenetetrahydrofolate dehydrogenase/5,10-methenyltetrahydrofolate cyclohydrolase [Candidatus Paceibacterota bacterium]|jgi:methylenetetrahydrofolate dehydrogenase (NADP+)/methenyltetrahydrofolate cyclohydrolase
MPKILYGRTVRDQIALSLTEEIEKLADKPLLAILQVGNDSRSTAYIKQKKIFGEKIGARVKIFNFPESAVQSEIIAKIRSLNSDRTVHGVIIQIPLPSSLNRQEVIDTIDPLKDVDGLTTSNQKFLADGQPRLIPATARGIFELLEYYQISVVGKRVTVMGRSALVGGPTAKLLALKGAEVKVVHTQTEKPKEVTSWADILVVAIGKAQRVDASYLRKGQVVVDVGVNSVSGDKLAEEISGAKLVGDVDFKQAEGLVSAISPVPGGVGPMTVAALFENLLMAYKMQNSVRQV